MQDTPQKKRRPAGRLLQSEGAWGRHERGHEVADPRDLAWLYPHCDPIRPTFRHPHIPEENLDGMLPRRYWEDLCPPAGFLGLSVNHNDGAAKKEEMRAGKILSSPGAQWMIGPT